MFTVFRKRRHIYSYILCRFIMMCTANCCIRQEISLYHTSKLSLNAFFFPTQNKQMMYANKMYPRHAFNHNSGLDLCILRICVFYRNQYKAVYLLYVTIFPSHAESRTISVMHACNHCQNDFSTKGNLNTHIRCKHQGERFICNHCNKDFSRRSTLSAHIRQHHRADGGHVCEVGLCIVRPIGLHIRSVTYWRGLVTHVKCNYMEMEIQRIRFVV